MDLKYDKIKQYSQV